MPPGRDETLPERPAVFYREVRDREAQFRSGAARPIPPPENGGLRNPIARETESEAHIRVARAAVPHLFREGGTHQGSHWRKPDGHARTPSRQCGLPDGLGGFAFPSPHTTSARPHSREGAQSQTHAIPRPS